MSLVPLYLACARVTDRGSGSGVRPWVRIWSADKVPVIVLANYGNGSAGTRKIIIIV